MSASGLPRGDTPSKKRRPPASGNWHGSCGKTDSGNRAAHSGRSNMDKFESFIFSVTLFAAGLITLVTLPLA